MSDYTSRIEKSMLKHLGYEVTKEDSTGFPDLAIYALRKRWPSDGGGEQVCVELEVAKVVAFHAAAESALEDIVQASLADLERFIEMNEHVMYRERIRLMEAE